jgi:DUF1009 family protein
MKIGILAGKGLLPSLIYQGCVKKGLECSIIGLSGQFSSDLFANIPHKVLPMHSISKIINEFKANGVTHIALAGKVKRANLGKLLFDKKGSQLFSLILKRGLQDNNILTSVILFLENEGFKIIPSDELAANITASTGSLGRVSPDASAIRDIKNGAHILKSIASYDIGQALIIQSGLILGVEAAEGTDALIKRCAALQQEGQPPAILVKIVKPKQDKRIDLPCVGVDTIKNLAQANMRGIAVQSGNCILLDSDAIQKTADASGIFVYGFEL